MQRMRGVLILIAIGALLALVAACSESDPSEAETPADASTALNTAPQTDEEGNTVPAPGAEQPAEPGEGDGEGEGEGGAAGDAAAGETFFASTCGGCHLNGGQDAGGVGPQLAGAGLDDAGIRDTVTNGQGAMPAGLASGEDLDNVVAYVLSIQ